eukprot:Selendium_serpulae@DN5037_c2_g1_i2.p2
MQRAMSPSTVATAVDDLDSLDKKKNTPAGTGTASGPSPKHGGLGQGVGGVGGAQATVTPVRFLSALLNYLGPASVVLLPGVALLCLPVFVGLALLLIAALPVLSIFVVSILITLPFFPELSVKQKATHRPYLFALLIGATPFIGLLSVPLLFTIPPLLLCFTPLLMIVPFVIMAATPLVVVTHTLFGIPLVSSWLATHGHHITAFCKDVFQLTKGIIDG